MKKKMYVHASIKPFNDVVLIEKAFMAEYLHEMYTQYWENSYSVGIPVESKESFKLKFILLEVDYDVQNQNRTEYNIYQSLKNEGYVVFSERDMYGNIYRATDKLAHFINSNLNKRRKLSGLN